MILATRIDGLKDVLGQVILSAMAINCSVDRQGSYNTHSDTVEQVGRTAEGWGDETGGDYPEQKIVSFGTSENGIQRGG